MAGEPRLGGPLGERLAALGPLLTADGSDSLSLDEALDLLLASGWRLDAALLVAIPDAAGLRREAVPELDALRVRTAGLLAPWDGPAALSFSDGTRVGAMLDRNGLRPLAISISHSGLVIACSEAGAMPLAAAETAQRKRLGPGEILVVDVERGTIRHDREAKEDAARSAQRPAASADHRAHELRAAEAVSLPIIAPDRAIVVAGALGGRARRREAAHGHQDDGPRGPRAAVVDG